MKQIYSCTIGDCFEHTIRSLCCSHDFEHRKGADKRDLWTKRIDGKTASVEIKSNSGRFARKGINKYVVYLLALPTDVTIENNRCYGWRGLAFTVLEKDFSAWLLENGYFTTVTSLDERQDLRICTLYDKCKDGGYKWRMKKYEPLLDWLEENDIGCDWIPEN